MGSFTSTIWLIQMPISHRYKAIFVHIPKTAGGSMEHVLGVHGDDNKGGNRLNSEILYGFETNPNRALQHLTAKEIREKVGPSVYQQYYKFAFVRNPFERFVSEFFWYKAQTRRQALTFDGFLKEALERGDDVHLKSQYEFISDENGRVMVDFIGRFEHLKRDFKKVRAALGIQEKLPHLSKAKPIGFVHYSDFYNEETKQIIYNRFRIDFEKFGYQFGYPSFFECAKMTLIGSKEKTICGVKDFVKHRLPYVHSKMKELLGK